MPLSLVPAASEPGCGLVGGGDDDDNSQEEEEEEARHGWYGIGFRVLLVWSSGGSREWWLADGILYYENAEAVSQGEKGVW